MNTEFDKKDKKRLRELEDEKKKLREDDCYLLDDPDGSGKRASDRKWKEILQEENSILRRNL